MRTIIIIGAGWCCSGLFVLGGRLFGGGNGHLVTAAKVFIPVWLAAAGFNMWMGVARAGYSVGEELPIFLVIFAIPAAAAGFVWWKLS